MNTEPPTIDALRDSFGNFSMLAIDQRGSLREMLSRASGDADIDDEALVAFKLAVSEELTPYASAVLLDRQFGGEAARAARCPVILAADLTSQSVLGGPVDQAELDPAIDSDAVHAFGASALKMLVPWTPDRRVQAMELSAEFMELCRSIGVPGIVEGVVRPQDIHTWSNSDRDDALVEAAADLGKTRPDLYKGEVPSYGSVDPEEISAVAARVSAVLACPWVVLSSGVRADDFSAAVGACRVAGASGFLAGRAIWADAIRASDLRESLRTTGVSRLRQLAGLAA